MPQASIGTSPFENLRTLVRGRRPPVTDPYVSRRQAEIESGLDDMLPEAESPDLQAAQVDEFQRTGFAPSRDAIRSSGMAALRSKLKMDAAEHEQELEREAQKGEYALRGQEATGRALADRLRYSQEAIGGRQEANQAAIMQRLDKTIGAQGSRQEDAQAFKVEHPTGGSTTVPAILSTNAEKARAAYEGARSSYGGTFGGVKRMLGTAGDEEQLRGSYESQLANVLDRKGDLEDAHAVLNELGRYKGSFDERVAQYEAATQGDATAYDLSQLHPLTRQYLQLKIGQ